MSDKPKNVLDVSALDLETSHEPIRVPAKGNGFITFPYPFDDDAEKVEEFLAELEKGLSNGRITPALKAWLPKAEYDKFAKAYPSYQARLTIVNAVTERFQASFGTPGEGDASAS